MLNENFCFICLLCLLLSNYEFNINILSVQGYLLGLETYSVFDSVELNQSPSLPHLPYIVEIYQVSCKLPAEKIIGVHTDFLLISGVS